MQKALITGASGGIGLEIAKLMAENGHDLVLAARSKDKLTTIKQKLESQYGISVAVYAADLSVAGSAQKLYTACRNEDVEILVNNAGAGYKGDFFGELQASKDIAYLNMNSLLDLTHYFGKDFVERGSGRILNIASVASFVPGPKQPVYFATKAFVRSLSRALAYNLRETGVTLTVLHPGVTRTSFFDAAGADGAGSRGATPHSVAKLGYKAMMAGKTEVTHGLTNKLLTNLFVRFVPYRAQTWLVDTMSEA